MCRRGGYVRAQLRRLRSKLIVLIFYFRYDLSEEATAIANRLNEHDVFMDLYHYADACSDSTLAAVAWRKAEQILAESATANLSSGNFEKKKKFSRCRHNRGKQ